MIVPSPGTMTAKWLQTAVSTSNTPDKHPQEQYLAHYLFIKNLSSCF